MLFFVVVVVVDYYLRLFYILFLLVVNKYILPCLCITYSYVFHLYVSDYVNTHYSAMTFYYILIHVSFIYVCLVSIGLSALSLYYLLTYLTYLCLFS